jgi:hypothetical protein
MALECDIIGITNHHGHRLPFDVDACQLLAELETATQIAAHRNRRSRRGL